MNNSVTFTITGQLPPSINALIRMDQWTRASVSRQFGWLIKAAISHADVKVLKAWKDLERKVRISMEVVTPQLYDEDNLSSIGKIPLDALVGQLQYLRGDSPRWVEFDKPVQRKGPKSITFKIAPV